MASSESSFPNDVPFGNNNNNEEDSAISADKEKEKEKKKKKKKEKKKKSSSKKEKKSKSSSSENKEEDDIFAGATAENSHLTPRSYSKKLLHGMMTDAYGEGCFANDTSDPFANDTSDPFADSVNWDNVGGTPNDDRDWGEEEEESKDLNGGGGGDSWSKGSASKGSASRGSRSKATTTADGSYTGSNTSDLPGVASYEAQLRANAATMAEAAKNMMQQQNKRRTNKKQHMAFEMPSEDEMFAQNNNNNEDGVPDGNDDDSVISEMTGLTGIFTTMHDVHEEEEEDADEEMPEIMQKFLEQQHLLEAQQQQQQLTMKSNLRRTPSNIASRPAAPKPKKVVTKKFGFSTITIRQYERILTENPSTIQGPSIGVGWRYKEQPAQELNFYETQRAPLIVPAARLILNREQRERLLIDLGYTNGHIAMAVRNNCKVRHQRRQTVQNLSAGKYEEVLEGLQKRGKRLWNPFSGNKDKAAK